MTNCYKTANEREPRGSRSLCLWLSENVALNITGFRLISICVIDALFTTDFEPISVCIIENETGWRKPSSNYTGGETAANLNSSNAKSVTVTARWEKEATCEGTYGRLINVNLAVNGVQNFDYTGNVDCAILQKAGYYKLEVWGAQGGSGIEGYAGYGGYSFGNIQSSASNIVYIVVGGQGTTSSTPLSTIAPGGYNGGGYSVVYNGNGEYPSWKSFYPGSGGGTTHISTVNCGELKNCESYKGTYNSSIGTYDGGSILIVAGGGGGTGYAANNTASNTGLGGNGGGINGGKGVPYIGDISSYTTRYTVAGSQNSGYAFGSGQDGYGRPRSGRAGIYGCQGGGGGGWYGGYAADASGSSTCNDPGGGGGSGYIGNSLLLGTKRMYCFNSNMANNYNYNMCNTSTATATYTVGTSNIGHAVANAVNTGNGYAKITYLGTSI